MKKRVNSKSYTPPGWRAVTPRLFAADPKGLYLFLKKVFKAKGRYQAQRPTEIVIDDSILMISGTEVRKPASGVLYVYVRDADATYQRAIAAGAKSIEKPFDTPYGDRRGIVKDKWGNTWQIATFVGS